MEIKLTAVFRKAAEGYIGFVEELPGANTHCNRSANPTYAAS